MPLITVSPISQTGTMPRTTKPGCIVPQNENCPGSRPDSGTQRPRSDLQDAMGLSRWPIALALPKGYGGPAGPETACSLPARMAVVDASENLADNFLRVRHGFLLRDSSPALWAHPKIRIQRYKNGPPMLGGPLHGAQLVLRATCTAHASSCAAPERTGPVPDTTPWPKGSSRT